eukprot:COSAG04_NODE_1634_length_6102_cov_20.966184_1_plen_101_part_10
MLLRCPMNVVVALLLLFGLFAPSGCAPSAGSGAARQQGIAAGQPAGLWRRLQVVADDAPAAAARQEGIAAGRSAGPRRRAQADGGAALSVLYVAADGAGGA